MRRLGSNTPVVPTLMLAVAVAACGGDDGPAGPGSDGGDEEYEAVVDALASSGALGGFGGVVLLAEPGDARIGTIDVSSGDSPPESHQAFAFQYVFDVTYEGERVQGTITGISAWIGLDVSARTVDQVLSVVALSDVPGGSSVELTGEDGLAYYIENAGDPGARSAYFGSAGTFSVSSVSLGGSESCRARNTEWSCAYRTGTMSGSFEFDASNFAQPPGEITRSSTFSGLPLIRVTMTGGS